MAKKKKTHDKTKDPDYKLAVEQYPELNKQFYDGFLDDFYELKVLNLLSLITNSDKAVDNIQERSIEIDALKIDADAISIKKENLTKYAKVELAMAYFHSMETLIRLFIAHAKLSGCPWLELARLSQNKYRTELEKIKRGKFSHFNSQLGDKETILFVFTGEQEIEGKEDLIEGYKEWLMYIAGELFETYDYNSFKHGLAVAPTHNGFTLGDKDKPTLQAQGEVIEHLGKIKRENRTLWARYTNFIKYDEKATFILLIDKMINSILGIGRCNHLNEDQQVEIFQANKFLPKDIKRDNDKDKSEIAVNGFKRGLTYYEST